MKAFLNHLYNGPHSHLTNIFLVIGGVSLWAFVNAFFGAFSLGAKALYDYRQLQKQKKQSKADEEEERIKSELYNEYLKKQSDEKK